MFRIFSILHILVTIIAFIVFDRIPLFKKQNWLFAGLIALVVISVAFALAVSIIEEFIFIILLFSWSFMNRREQALGITMLHLSLAFSMPIIMMQLLPTTVQIYLILEASNFILITYMIVELVLLTLFAFLLRKFLQIKVSNKTQTYLGYISFFTLLVYEMYRLYTYVSWFLDSELQSVIQILVVFMILLVTISLISIGTLSRNQQLALETQKKALEYQAMENYIQEITEQNREIHKFRHDYLNILASLESYMEEDNFEELKQFYQQSIQPTKTIFSNHFTKLNALQQIDNSALRSILMTKLLLAQERGLSINLEIASPIHLPESIDPVILVRIIGILLDNALEELTALQHGQLEVALINIDNDTMIVIQNAARKSIEPLHQLKKSGFSTRGEKRGLGLSIIDDLIKQEPSLLLETSIEKQLFTQKLTLMGE